MLRSIKARRWPDTDHARPRVLVEYGDDAVAYSIQRVLDAQGYETAVCGGPFTLRRGRCPLVQGGTCELAAGADLILNGLDLGAGENRAVLRALHEHLPDVPVVAEVPMQRQERNADLLDGIAIVPFPMTRESLLAAVRDRLRPA